MKTKPLYFLLLLCLYYHSSIAQDEATQKPNFLSIGITPLNLVEPITSTLEGALEVQLANGFNIESKFGFKLEALNPFSHERINDQYYEVKFGAKYRIVKFSNIYTQYIGLEYFHLHQQYERSASWFIKNDLPFTYDAADISRTVHGLRLKYGHLLFTKGNWIFEAYTGLGFRKVNLDYDTVNQQQESFPFWNETIFRIDRTEGETFKFDAVFGIKISYKIFKW